MKDKQPTPLPKDESKSLNDVNATFSSVLDTTEDPEQLAKKYDRAIAAFLIVAVIAFLASMAFIYDKKLTTIIQKTDAIEEKLKITAQNKDGEQVEVSIQQALTGLYQQNQAIEEFLTR